jgi:Ca2+-dependent lipid-binding protein
MNLPLLSDFVYSSVRAAAHEFVAPASYTLDLSKLLVGDDSKKVLQSIGILVVNVHSAYGLRPADINGQSDCYITLSYSKFAKPLWSSRIIFRDLNPVWDETAILVVGVNELKAKERYAY